MLLHPLHIIIEAGRASPGGDDGVVERQGVVEDLGLEFPVQFSVVFVEKVVDGDLISFLKEPVGVVGLPAQLFGQPLGGGRLTCAHISD